MMDWNQNLIAVFSISNLLIFFSYLYFGTKHFSLYFLDKEKLHNEVIKSHLLHGLFITSCGVGHAIMALHMYIPVIYSLVISHVIIATVSIFSMIHSIKNLDLQNSRKVTRKNL